MGLFNGMRNVFGEHSTPPSSSQQPQAPSFEQLEPRILLSADASLVPDFQPLETFEEQVVSVDLQPGLGTEEGRRQKAEVKSRMRSGPAAYLYLR